MRYLFVIAFAFTLFSCNQEHSKKMQHGPWLGEMQLKAQEKLPFNFEVTSDTSLKIYNADEVILVDDVSYRNDSVYIKMPVFEGYFAVKLIENGMVGNFIDPSLDLRIPFEATYNVEERFKVNGAPKADASGKWEVVFNDNSDEDRYLAKGIFQQKGQRVTGTFRTKTGDYRYLEGIVNGDTLKMSTFDGAHAFLFIAQVTDSTMNGVFYSGNTDSIPFKAKRNDIFELPDANTLTSLKEGYERLEFSFPNENGQMISLTDALFKDKVVVVQMMGTWCPNCLDESIFFSEYYKNNSDKAIEFVALAFENAKTEALAFGSIKRLKERLGIEYPVLLAQFGTSDKAEAQKKLPMLSDVLSYPTTIFIDKTGKVRKIHTGFNGPATGEKYVEFKKEFGSFIEELLAE